MSSRLPATLAKKKNSFKNSFDLVRYFKCDLKRKFFKFLLRHGDFRALFGFLKTYFVNYQVQKFIINKIGIKKII